jgi:hypothetical protein
VDKRDLYVRHAGREFRGRETVEARLLRYDNEIAAGTETQLAASGMIRFTRTEHIRLIAGYAYARHGDAVLIGYDYGDRARILR